MLTARRLRHFIDSGSNNFSLLRLVAAACVVISHALFLGTGNALEQPLSGVTRYNLGQHAVNVFFVLSGVMVAGSLERSPSLLQFGVARALRIFPALIVCGLLTAFALAPLVTSLPLDQLLRDPRIYLSPLQTSSLTFSVHTLPGVFDNVPMPQAINHSLWTLKYEALCYVLLAIMAGLGAWRSEAAFRAVLVVSLLVGVAGSIVWSAPNEMPSSAQIARFWLCFSLGLAAYRYRELLPLSFGLLAIIGGAYWVSLGTDLELALTYAFTGYGALVLATVGLHQFRTWSNTTDLSYGLYIYGWPITQLLVWRFPGIEKLTLVIASLLLAGAAAWLSWTFVEKPSLRARNRVTGLLWLVSERVFGVRSPRPASDGVG